MLQNPPVDPTLLAKQAEKEFSDFFQAWFLLASFLFCIYSSSLLLFPKWLLESTKPRPRTPLKKVKKTSNYQEHEDITICQAWIQVSEEHRVGTHQDRNTFWVQIFNLYKKEVSSSTFN